MLFRSLLRNVSEQQGIEGWVAEKITLAGDYLHTVADYMEGDGQQQELAESSGQWGDTEEILRGVLHTLEREVEWPLTEIMDLRTVKMLLAPLHNAINDKINSLSHEVAEGGYRHGFADPNSPSLDNRGARNRERSAGLGDESNNLQISINGRPWKVIPGRGHADSMEERKYLHHLQAWAEKKSASSGKTWTVSLTGAPVTLDENTAGAFASVPATGSGPNVGTLFGGNYKPKTPFNAKKKKTK